jgi:hypothetical protein
MSISYIPENVKIRLWGKAAGRCEYDGCTERLWLDSLTKSEFNVAYIAHIVADKPEGPRGDPVLSDKLKASISNLMLLCDRHHRLVDVVDVAGHPVELLHAMKESHERRMNVLTSISPDKQSHIVLYGANIGLQTSPVSYNKARVAMAPDWYPAETEPISLGMLNSSFEDFTEDYWSIESTHLKKMFQEQIRPRLALAAFHHLSIFALAPQPLLILLGTLLSDIQDVEVYQLHREPAGWKWQEHTTDIEYLIQEPDSSGSPPALSISLSATITDDRITVLFPSGVSLWRLTIAQPHNDFLQSREQARRFRQTARILLDAIKARHGQQSTLHVFPAMPAALAVEFGRILAAKADLPLMIYDQNKSLGGFAYSLTANQMPTHLGDSHDVDQSRTT